MVQLSSNIDSMSKSFETQRVGKPLKVYIFLLLVYSSLLFIYFVSDHREGLVWGHSFFDDSGNTLLNATQTQQNENYVVDLFIDPSIPSVDRDINFTLEIKSKANDVLIELPVAVYILKDGKPVFSNPNNYTLVRQQHYDFDHTFNEPGIYSLAVDIKDIFYTLDIAHFEFEIDVDDSAINRIIELLGNYYYLFIPMIILVVIFAVIDRRTRKIRS